MAKDKSIPSNIVLAKEKFKYDTIQDMVNDITLKVGMVVDINGYYKPDDGATHKRVIADTDDGSGVQLRSGKWANIVHNGEVNVSWFGAKGDGVTDDTEAMQKALDNAMIIKLDNKTYLTSIPLIISKNQTLQGVSRDGTYIMFNPSSSLTYDIGTVEVQTLPIETLKQINACIIPKGAQNHTNIKIKNITLKTNSSDNKGKYGLLIPYVVYSTFENINIDWFEQGFRVLQGWNNIVTNVRVGGRVKYGFYFKDNRTEESLKTSWLLDKLYADYCDVGFSFMNITYSNISSIACDHATTYCYMFDRCDVAINGIGAEATSGQIIKNKNSTIIINGMRILDISKGEIPPESETDALFEIDSSSINGRGIMLNGTTLSPNSDYGGRKLCYIKGAGQFIANNITFYKVYDIENYIKENITSSNDQVVVSMNNYVNLAQVNGIEPKKLQALYNKDLSVKQFLPMFKYSNADDGTLKSVVKIKLEELYKVFDISEADVYIRLPLKFHIISGGSYVCNVIWLNPTLITSNQFNNNLEIMQISMTETTLDITLNKEIKNEVVYISLA